MPALLIFVCLFVVVGLTGAPDYVDFSWTLAGLGLFLMAIVLLMLIPGRRSHTVSPGARHPH